MFRGYEIKWNEKTGWIFSDTGKSTIETWQKLPCGHCGKYNTIENYDGCIGFIPGAINACCGHGQKDEAYIQFSNNICIYGKKAMLLIKFKQRWLHCLNILSM